MIPVHIIESLYGSLRASEYQATATIQLIHIEIYGLVQPSLAESPMTIKFLNDYSSKSEVKMTKNKSEFFNALED